jgi:PAS domain S-box-containing protein
LAQNYHSLKAFRTVITLILACSIQFAGWSQLFTFKRFNHRDGLITESTLCSRQDRDGYLWIGTDGGGMMRFDGKRFLEIKHIKQQQPFHVSDIQHGDDGYTYLTTLYDGAFKYKNGVYKLIYKPDRDKGDCRKIVVGTDRIIVFTDYTIDLINNNGKLLVSKRFKNGATSYKQVLQTPYFSIVFSSSGNFIIYQDQILPLSLWLKKNGISTSITAANFSKNKLQLINLDGGTITEISYSSSGKQIRKQVKKFNTNGLKNAQIYKTDSQGNTTFFITNDEEIFRLSDGKITYVINNLQNPIDQIHGLSVDFNGDLWVNANGGITKVSIEPFTKINLLKIYDDPSIMLVYKTRDNTLILGNAKGDLYIGNIYAGIPPENFKMRGYQVIECPLGTLIATNKGIFTLRNGNLNYLKGPPITNKEINFIHWDGQSLWFSEKGRGLSSYDPKSKSTTDYRNITKEFPNYFYTAQNNFDQSKIYFGTNNGIFSWDKRTHKFVQFNKLNKYGSYCGNSTKDKFGTMWFTLDKALIGITKNGETVIIDDAEKLPSTLFYTLSADNYGNLLVGTNRGINVIRVDHEGHALRHRNYSISEGFGGYETNMRAVYQNGNNAFVGTIEGLYQINSNILESYPIPPKPLIIRGRELLDGSIQGDTEDNYFTIKSVMSKTSGVLFSYRFPGINDNWSNYSRTTEIIIPELSNGNHTIQVKASYDGINSSEITTHNFSVQNPLWKNKWFIVTLIVLIGVLNILFVQWNKTLVPTHVTNAQDFGISSTIIPRLIGLAFLFNLIIQLLLSYTLRDKFEIDPLMYIQSSILLALFITSMFSLKRQLNASVLQLQLIITYVIIILGYFVLLFQTKLHPSGIFGIIISAGVSPYIFKSIRWVMLSSISMILLSITTALLVEQAQFSVLLFIASVTIAAALAVVVAVLRSDSLQKLIFVNALVNKGNVIMISFDQHNLVHYCSSNISNYFTLTAENLLNKPLSMLNDIVASNEMRQISINESFVDGKTFLVPMKSKGEHIIYMEWSCKYLSQNVQVIMGQDVTDKLTMANNYQALVENAQEIIYTTDIQGNFTFANERAIQVFGYRQDTILGKSSFFQVTPEYREQVESFYRDQFKQRTHYTYLEFPIRTRDGKLMWISQNITLQYEPGNKKRISGFLALARDITEKRANELLIDQQNKDINASINSAKRIQFNLLPNPTRLQQHFQESFLLFRPKDVVSGDFYWFGEINGKWIMAVADATGHGVPGAFMTILGIQLLNQIICERKVLDATKIVKAFQTELSVQLHQSDETSRDNLELLVVVKDGSEIKIASSGVGCLVASKERTLILSKDKSEIKEFAFQADQGDKMYLFTDGMYVQQGGLSANEFGIDRFTEFLQSIENDNMPLQKKHLENTLRNWSEGHTQNDDITIIGVRF